MIEKKIKIVSKDGIHMRPAMYIVDEAVKYESEIIISNNDSEADAKSIMELTMLALIYDEEIIITADGEDEEKAVEALEELISSNFNDYSSVKE